MSKRNLVSMIRSLLFLVLLFLTTLPYETAIETGDTGSIQQISSTPPITSISPVQGRTNIEAKIYLVTRVIDGDTIELSNGEKVRYIGIDTPERPASKESECFAKEAQKKNAELVLGKNVRLEKDVSERDRYKRLLRYVYIEDAPGVSEEIFVNDLMVREGYATALTYPPDVAYSEQFRQAENEAREKNLGLWSICRS